ncbi:MAG: copper transporter family protein [Planctomycetota bacterium]
MDKLTVFFIVFLYACLRGLLRRRHVREELERRLEAARSKSKPAIRSSMTPPEAISHDSDNRGDTYGQTD